MPKKNGRGFTLVELLAVFVVLAIIAVIAVPTVNNLIKDSRKESFAAGMRNIRDAAKYYIERAHVDENIEEDSCIYFSFDDDVNEIKEKEVNGELRTYAPVASLELKGDIPTVGEVKICDDTYEVNISNGEFSGSLTEEESVVIEGDLSTADISTPVIKNIHVNSKTTSSIKVSVSAYTPNRYGKIVAYYFSLDGKDYKKATNNTYEFTSLKVSTNYTVYVKVESKSGRIATRKVNVSTASFDEISFSVKPTADWSVDKTVTINGSTVGATLQYRIGRYDDSGVWQTSAYENYIDALFFNDMVTEDDPLTIYARFVDGTNTSGEKTLTITKIDTSAPTIKSRSVSTLPNSLEIEFAASDGESGIDEVICEYGSNYALKGTISGNKCIISQLTSGTTYEYRLRVINNVGLSSELSGSATTVTFPEIEMSVNPDGWSNKKTVTLTGSADGYKLQYKVRTYNESTSSYEETTFKDYTGPIELNTIATVTYPTTITAQYSNGVSISKPKTLTITKLDDGKPIISISGTKSTTKTITLMYKLEDALTSIASYNCEYGTTDSYGSAGTSTATSCVLSGLDKGKKYYYRITAIDIVGNTKTYEGSTVTGTTDVTFGLTQTPSNTTYATSKKLTVTYSTNNVSTPSYYFKSTTTTTVDNGVYACENDSNNNPINCDSSAVTSIKANTWYKTKNTVINLNFVTNGTVYTVINDGDSYLTASTIVIGKIDTSKPDLSIGDITTTTSSITIPFASSDNESGITSTTCVYGTSKSYGMSGEIKDGKCYLKNLTNGVTYYYKIETTNGSGMKSASEMSSKPGEFGSCSISVDDPKEKANWSINKTVTISGITKGAELQYRIGSTGDWLSHTSGDTIKVENPTTVYCRFYDETNVSNPGSLVISKIDPSAPTNVDFSYTTTTSSIKVTASATDEQSGITGYQFSKDGGTSWTTVQSSPTYTFTSLTSGTYSVVVKAVNNTYIVNGAVSKNSTASSKKDIAPDKIGECSITVTPKTGWAVSKTAKFNGSANGATLQYKIGTNGAWTDTVDGKELSLTDAASVSNPINLYCRITDKTNIGATNNYAVTTIDPTAPTAASFSYSTTTNSISVIATGTDAESGIYGYQFSKDGGATWSSIQTSNSYTFSNLKSGTYTVAIKAINGTYVNSGIKDNNYKIDKKDIGPKEVPKCSVTFEPSSGWSISKNAIIGGTLDGATLQVSVGDLESWETVPTSGKVPITTTATTSNPLTVYCRFYDGINYGGQASSTTTTIDPTAPSELGFSYATTSNAIKLIANVSDDESGIYGYQFSKDGGSSWTSIQTSNEYTFGGLKSGTYTMGIRAINGTYVNNGIVKGNSITKYIDLYPETITECNIDILPSGWASKKTVTITGSTTGAELQYKLKVYNFDTKSYDETTFEPITSGTTVDLEKMATSTYPTYVYCRITDGINTVDGETMTVASIDTSAPSASLSATMYTSQATLKATCSDSESGITKYEFSKDGGASWTTAQTSNEYKFTGLTQGTSYSNFRVRCTNGTKLNEIGKTTGTTPTIIAPTWTATPSGYTSGNKVATVTYSAADIANAVYFLKGTTTGTTNVALTTCSTASSSTPKKASECTGTAIAANGSVVANTWYMVKSGATASITVSSNGNWYAVTSDGTNTKSSSTLTVAGIDKTPPSVSLSATMYTSQATLTATCKDTESGITKYEFSKDGGTSWIDNGTSNTYSFTGLASGTTYSKFKARCTNGAKLTATADGTGSTKLITAPTWTATPSGYTSENKVAKVTYTSTGIVSPVYFLKGTTAGTTNVALTTCSTSSSVTPKKASECTGTAIAANGSVVANTWYMVKSGATASITVSSNGNWYAVTSDGTNTKSSSTLTVAGIDKTPPSANLSVTSNKTDRISVAATCKDTESGITKYEFSKDGGTNWTNNGTTSTYTFTGLTQSTTYSSLMVRCTNGAGLNAPGSVSGGTLGIVAPTWTATPSGYTSGNKVAKVTYTSTGIVSPVYFLKGTTAGTTNVALTTCSTSSSNTPKKASECTGTAIAANGSVAANTWYMVKSGATASITVSSNGNWYAVTSDGTNTKSSSTLTVAGIDKTPPSASLSVTSNKTDRISVSAVCKDTESGITKYEFSKDGGTNWTNNGTTSTYTFTGLTQSTTYSSLMVRCTNGAGLNAPGSVSGGTLGIVAPTWTATPSGYTSGTKVAKVTYSSSNISSPVYFLKGTTTGTTNVALTTCSTASSVTPKKASECTGTAIVANGSVVANTWYMVKSGATASITVSSNGNWYAVTSDGTNTKSSSTLTVAGIDKTPPSASLTATMYTNQAKLTAACADTESGITKYEFSKDSGSTWTSNGTTNTYTFTGLVSGTSFNFKVRCTNGANLTNTSEASKNTSGIIAPTWTATPSGYTSGNKVAKVTYTSTGIVSPVYFLKGTTAGTTNVALTTCSTASSVTPKKASECTGTAIAANGSVAANTWYMVKSGATASITVSSNGNWYAVTSDGTNTRSSSTLTVAGIDKTVPEVSLSVTSNKTDRISVSAVCKDTESGITKYEFSKDGGTNWTNNGTTSTYTFTGLTQSTTYSSLMVRCTNGAGLNAPRSVSGGTLGIVAPTWTATPSGYTSGTKVAKVTYSSSNISSPVYFLKGTTTGTTNVALTTCSTASSVTPKKASECTGTAIAANGSVAANTWYMVKSGATASITVSSNGNWYAVTSDGTNTKSSSTLTVTGIDKTVPVTSLEVTSTKSDRVSLKATCTDTESGITKYEFSKDSGSTWTSNGTTNTYTYTGLTQGTSYAGFRVRCTNGASLTNTASASGLTTSITGAGWTATPSGYTTGNKVATVTYSSSNIISPVYFLKGTTTGTTNVALTTCSTVSSVTPKKASECTGTTVAVNGSVVANTWYMIKSGTTASITVSSNGNWYAVTSDGTNTKASPTLTVAGIDKTPPGASLATTMYTNQAKLTATCTDIDSGITKYEFSKDGGSTWTSNGTTNTYTYTGLVSSTSFNFKVRCTNGAGLTNTAASSKTTSGIVAPTWTATPSGYTSGNKVAKVTYTSTGIVSPVYFLKGTTTGTTNVALTTCSTASSVTPKSSSECTGTAIAVNGSVTANKWYMVKSGATASITVSSNGNWYAVTSDGTNTRSSSTLTVSGIDKGTPTVSVSGTVSSASWTNKNVTLTANASGSSSGYSYQWYTSTNPLSAASGGTAISGATSSTYTIQANSVDYYYKTYYVVVTTGAGKKATSGLYTLYFDTSAPPCSGTLSGASTTWASSRTIKATCYDSGSGCTEGTANYSWTYSNATTKTADVSYKLTDKAGNGTTCNATVNVYVDKTGPVKPTVSLKLGSVSGSTYTSGNWTTSDVWHIAKSSDSESGVSYYQYSHDGVGWTSDITSLGWGAYYSDPTTKQQLNYAITWSGAWNFYVRAVDKVGNVSANSTMFTVKIDENNPTVSATVGSSSGSGSSYSRTINVTHSDATSTSVINSCQVGKYVSSSCSYSTAYSNLCSISTNSVTVSNLTSGQYCYKINVYDSAGNATSTSGTFTVGI